MGYHTCKERCRHFKGYIKGSRHYMKNGNRWCSLCNYQIKTNDLRCWCCGSIFRIKAHKMHPYSMYQNETPHIAKLTVVNVVDNCRRRKYYLEKKKKLLIMKRTQ
jgi:hypothetical protein